MKLKKFEFFDTDDLKSKHEIDYLKGDMPKLTKKIEHDFKKEKIDNLLVKLTNYYPFLEIFIDAGKQDVEIDGIKAVVYEQDSGFYCLTLESTDYDVVLGIKIHNMNSYEVAIYKQCLEVEGEEGFEGYEFNEETGGYLDINKLVEVIKQIYITFIYEAGFGDIIDINIKKFAEINN